MQAKGQTFPVVGYAFFKEPVDIDLLVRLADLVQQRGAPSGVRGRDVLAVGRRNLVKEEPLVLCSR